MDVEDGAVEQKLMSKTKSEKPKKAKNFFAKQKEKDQAQRA